jgi:hypothetical protein
MSDLAKPAPPGKEQAHNGNVSPAQKPAGQELATNKNGDLAHLYKDLAV